ncbi:DNA-binding protein [Oceanicoccus sp. KOV_DT_Chl]|uniref:helix-turn-helix domain-containing transcriptional regulator n=1 Tax=Oceanicoccus sp. KOV_DT_Chl TaxID=1904639 RepID=UPI000C7B85A8|nr:hypothetical protein [Oceanicoccus sp. KOV_DT_Chl]
MPLTRDFKETVMEACQDPEFRFHLIQEAIGVYLNGEVQVGNALLRDYINATGCADQIASEIGVAVPSLRRMLSAKGNPTAKNLLHIIRICRQREGLDDKALFRAA